VDFERDEASALERLCERLKTVRSRPRAILGCTYPFDGVMFSEVLDRIGDALQLDPADLGRIPVDVICDRALYRGHALDRRFRVHLYPGNELFHAKLLILLLGEEIIWISGSGNLTRAGYCSNREIALLNSPGNCVLPAALRRALAKLPGDAARVIRNGTSDGPRAPLWRGRFHSSLDAPIGPRFLSRAPRGVAEVHILAPFFEQAADVETIDEGWLDTLRRRFPSADYHIYLPQLESGRKPVVQGDRGLFQSFAAMLDEDVQLRFHPVPRDPGPSTES
jgi:hypothetical protein